MTSSRRTMPFAVLSAVVLVGLLAVAGCGGSSSTSQAQVNGIIVKDAEARASAASATVGAAYLTIENTTANFDRLSSVSVPADVARTAQFHETVEVPASTAGASSMMAMREVASVPVAAGATVRLEPGGLHIMLIDLAAPLTVGQKFTINLGFTNAGVVPVVVVVKGS